MRFLALLKRELQALFLSPIATVVFTVFLFFNGLLLSVILFNATQGVPMASSQIYGGWLGSGFTWIGMALYLPVITMRLMSEEKRQGSLELLLTTPISDLSVILSKWLGAFLFYLALWSPTAIIFLFLRLYAPLDYRLYLCSMLMIALIGALWCAIGLLFSTLTSHMIISALLTGIAYIGSLLAGYMATALEHAFPGTAGGWQSSLIALGKLLNIFDAMENFAKGAVDSRVVVFHLSLTALCLLLTHQLLAARRYRG